MQKIHFFLSILHKASGFYVADRVYGRDTQEIQGEIVAIGNKASKNQITEKHARALLALNKFPNEQTELFDMIKNGKNSISGDEAIEKAKEMKGEEKIRLFKVSYHNIEELIDKLQRAIQKLKKIKEGSPR